jgi:hypothetical protein
MCFLSMLFQSAFTPLAYRIWQPGCMHYIAA